MGNTKENEIAIIEDMMNDKSNHIIIFTCLNCGKRIEVKESCTPEDVRNILNNKNYSICHLGCVFCDKC